MSSSLTDSFDQLGGDSPVAGPTQLFDDGFLGYHSSRPSQQFDSFSNFSESEAVKEAIADESPIFISEKVLRSPSSQPIYNGLGSDPAEFSAFSPEADEPHSHFAAADGPILPPSMHMPPEESFALRQWRSENAVRLEKKEQKEKEILSQIIEEADEYKGEFYRKREIACDTNRAANRGKEKLSVDTRDKFHAEADKNYWKAIAELIPSEVPSMEKKKGNKDQENKPSVTVIQGTKPGKPTELSRMRQILLKLKHNAPAHLKLSPPSPPSTTEDGKADTSKPAVSTAVTLSSKPVAVA